MIQNLRKCIIQSHEYSFCNRICTFKGCEQNSRWSCAECLNERIH